MEAQGDKALKRRAGTKFFSAFVVDCIGQGNAVLIKQLSTILIL